GGDASVAVRPSCVRPPAREEAQRADPAERRRRSVPQVAGVVIVVHGKQFPLGEGERATLESFLGMRTELAAVTIRRKIKDAGDGGKVAIDYEPERDCLEKTLEDVSVEPQYFSGELSALLEAARIPMSARYE